MKKKAYFASDFHLGIDTDLPSKERERLIVSWLDQIKMDASQLFLLGDLLDYWFEYKATVPKGRTRLFGKLAELSDSGIHIEWYTGNHDMWDFGYFEKELGIKVFKSPKIRTILGKKCYLCHGDGLGPGDHRYKLIKSIFNNPICQFLFSIMPSTIGLWIMKKFSSNSRHHQDTSEVYLMEKESRLFTFFRSIADRERIDYFIYGHLHSGKREMLSGTSSECINLGDWTRLFTYAEMNKQGEIQLLSFK